jgi:hypothetical protein
LFPGDLITTLDGCPIRSSLDLTDRLDRTPARTPISIEIIRGQGVYRQHLAFSLKTGSRAESAQSPADLPKPTVRAPGDMKKPEEVVLVPLRSTSPATSNSPLMGAEKAVQATLTSKSDLSLPPATGSAMAKASEPVRHQRSSSESGKVGHAGSEPVLIPPPARTPLRAAVPLPQAQDLHLNLPKAVTDRIEQLERRLEKLERQQATLTVPPHVKTATRP